MQKHLTLSLVSEHIVLEGKQVLCVYTGDWGGLVVNGCWRSHSEKERHVWLFVLENLVDGLSQAERLRFVGVNTCVAMQRFRPFLQDSLPWLPVGFRAFRRFVCRFSDRLGLFVSWRRSPGRPPWGLNATTVWFSCTDSYGLSVAVFSLVLHWQRWHPGTAVIAVCMTREAGWE